MLFQVLGGGDNWNCHHGHLERRPRLETALYRLKIFIFKNINTPNIYQEIF
jgi:hypothetical protein